MRNCVNRRKACWFSKSWLGIAPRIPRLAFRACFSGGKGSTTERCLLDFVVEWWLLFLLGIFCLKILIIEIYCVFLFNEKFRFGIYQLGLLDVFGTLFFCPDFLLSVAMRPYLGDERYQTKCTSLFAGDPSCALGSWSTLRHRSLLILIEILRSDPCHPFGLLGTTGVDDLWWSWSKSLELGEIGYEQIVKNLAWTNCVLFFLPYPF